ncbi:MAG: hypothetical protein ACHQT8_07860, partial [Chlamydiales bacterium]
MKRYLWLICNALVPCAIAHGSVDDKARDISLLEQLEVQEGDENHYLEVLKREISSFPSPDSSSLFVPSNLECEISSDDTAELVVELDHDWENTINDPKTTSPWRSQRGDASSIQFAEKVAKAAELSYFQNKFEVEPQEPQELMNQLAQEVASNDSSDFLKEPLSSDRDAQLEIEEEALSFDLIPASESFDYLEAQIPSAVVENTQKWAAADETSNAIASQFERDYPPPVAYSFIPKRIDFRHVQ